jgi:hypothetical protein
MRMAVCLDPPFAPPPAEPPSCRCNCNTCREPTARNNASFDNTALGMLTVFQAMTLSGWSFIMYRAMDATSPVAVAYFVLLVGCPPLNRFSARGRGPTVATGYRHENAATSPPQCRECAAPPPSPSPLVPLPLCKTIAVPLQVIMGAYFVLNLFLAVLKMKFAKAQDVSKAQCALSSTGGAGGWQLAAAGLQRRACWLGPAAGGGARRADLAGWRLAREATTLSPHPLRCSKRGWRGARRRPRLAERGAAATPASWQWAAQLGGGGAPACIDQSGHRDAVQLAGPCSCQPMPPAARLWRLRRPGAAPYLCGTCRTLLRPAKGRGAMQRGPMQPAAVLKGLPWPK